MKPIKELLNKIIWDPREQIEDYQIIYYDRIEAKELELPFAAIKRIEGNFLILKNGAELPMHRITKLKKKGKIVWSRHLLISRK